MTNTIGDDSWVLRGRVLGTPSGPEGSSGNQLALGDVELPYLNLFILQYYGKYIDLEVHSH
ncbi:uncharacterized protein METZ01_LOCUS375658 [marine metagenome]|uniref:Uncharacterized protein n=1 Tax=marine metagenome TaxID=408172 RepID=A0A382TL19_9ZZZZ